MPVRSDPLPTVDVAEQVSPSREIEPDDATSVGGGVLLAVGPVVTYFSWWSWWTVAGIVLIAAGALWLALSDWGHPSRKRSSSAVTN